MDKTKKEMENLKFRRQFLFTAKKCDVLQSWNSENLGSHYLYTHPDCGMTRVNTGKFELLLIGYILDPKREESTDLDILKTISTISSIHDMAEKLYSLTGRFVLLIKEDNEFTFFHDPCGLKMLFYTYSNQELYAASQPLLLELVTDVKKGNKYKDYYASQYVKENIEHWIPSGSSLYDDVSHLVPNHYINSSISKQIRYWPNTKLGQIPLIQSVNIFFFILKMSMHAADKRFKLTLPLTAGWDSRIILASSKDILNDIWSYTLKYRDLTEESNDIKVPKNLSEYLSFKYTVIDCNKPVDKTFSKIYENNTDIPHMNDWGKIAYGMQDAYPENGIAVKGNCSEVGRCFYFPNGKHTKIDSSQNFLDLVPYWEDIGFIQERIFEWYEEVKLENIHMGYDLYDLFYWEHRMGSWQAQSQLEWDIVQEVFSPFNNRELFDTMLSLQPKYRVGTSNLLFRKSIENLWKETLMEPINYLSPRQRIQNMTKDILVKIGIFDTLKSMLNKVSR